MAVTIFMAVVIALGGAFWMIRSAQRIEPGWGGGAPVWRSKCDTSILRVAERPVAMADDTPASAEMGWISMQERKPPRDTEVFVVMGLSAHDEEMLGGPAWWPDVAEYRIDDEQGIDGFINGDGIYTKGEITHWMLIPPLPDQQRIRGLTWG
jgi:hypothetical protein